METADSVLVSVLEQTEDVEDWHVKTKFLSAILGEGQCECLVCTHSLVTIVCPPKSRWLELRNWMVEDMEVEVAVEKREGAR